MCIDPPPTHTHHTTTIVPAQLLTPPHTHALPFPYAVSTLQYITLDHGDEGADPVGFPEDAANLDDDVKHTGKATLRKGKADPPGVLYHSQRIQASFRAENHLHWFPFDKHNLVSRAAAAALPLQCRPRSRRSRPAPVVWCVVVWWWW